MPNELILPEYLWTQKRSIGTVSRLLVPAQAAIVSQTETINVSARRTALLHACECGSRFVVTEWRQCPLVDGTDGVLLVDGDTTRWLHHRAAVNWETRIEQGLYETRCQIADSWIGNFGYRSEQRDAGGNVVQTGLRPPQLGALFGIGAHWSLHHSPATIVMPTGTGKTETMLSALIAFPRGPLLVVVPSSTLRRQTARKFLTLGLLRELSLVPDDCQAPIVGLVTSRPREDADLSILQDCNVIVGTPSALGQGPAVELGSAIASRVGTLIVDEAHHVAAKTWQRFRTNFDNQPVLQYTATPFRRDGQLVDGEVIYSYPLRRAQQDGYFKPISFEPVWELDTSRADSSIAGAAITKLRQDLEAGLNHMVMARCSSIQRATHVHSLYQEQAPDLNPVLVHSEHGDSAEALDQLTNGISRIVVCVDMLGEGFDLPQLKIAAIHDTHKSIAVLLQFAGRFTRVAGDDVGNATAIANLADQDVSAALERLYSEDADWNHLLSEISSEAVREHAELVAFLRDSNRLDDEEGATISVSSSLLRPKFSTAVFECQEFRPRQFYRALSAAKHVAATWLNEASNTLFFVTRIDASVQWTRSKEIKDRQWDLFVIHYEEEHGMLYLHASDKSTLHEDIAQAVSGDTASLMSGDRVFRALGRIARLKFQNIGVRKHGRRNIRYAMYTGADVAEALSVSQRTGAIKANLSGDGFRDGKQITVGCSYKGRVWSKEQGTIRGFIDWCHGIGELLRDESIDTGAIIENVLVPKEVDELPDKEVLALEWPHEMLAQAEERVSLVAGLHESYLGLAQLRFDETDRGRNSIEFGVITDDFECQYTLAIGGDNGFMVTHRGGPEIQLTIGRLVMPLHEYLSSYPPLVLFVDLAELDGNLLYESANTRDIEFPAERFEIWEWDGTDFRQESMWKDGTLRPNSIQSRAVAHYETGGFDLIFDDDAKGEAADLICFKEEEDYIRLALVHCKFTTSEEPGERLSDIVEVCSQAVRSAKWVGQFKKLCKHISGREQRLRKPERDTRFVRGNGARLNQVLRASRFKPINTEIVIVQPGLSQEQCTVEQTAVLAAAHSYLLDTVAVGLDIACSP